MTLGYVPRQPIKQLPQLGVPGVPAVPAAPAVSAPPTMGNHMYNPAVVSSYGQQAQGLLGNPQPGPYGAQALQLAGLLGFGNPATRQFPVMSSPYMPGRFMPGFRPGIDTPSPGGGGGRRYGAVQQF